MASRENLDPPENQPTDLDRWNQAGEIFGLPPDTLDDFYVYTEVVHARGE